MRKEIEGWVASVEHEVSKFGVLDSPVSANISVAVGEEVDGKASEYFYLKMEPDEALLGLVKRRVRITIETVD